MKNVDLDEPTSILDHVYLAVLNVNANRMKLLLKNIQRCLNPVFQLGQLKFTGVGEDLQSFKSLP